MEWKNEIEELYREITDQIPEDFRISVKPMLREAAGNSKAQEFWFYKPR